MAAISINSSSKDIMEAINNEYDRAIYWINKSLGSDRKYQETVQRIIKKASESPNHCARTEAVYYTPASGNKWVGCLVSELEPTTGEYACNIVAELYYETMGSIGAFHVTYSPVYKRKEVVVFTSHFFLRYCDEIRKMAKMDGVNTVLDFIMRNQNYASTDFVNEDGKRVIDSRFDECIGRGIVRQDDDRIAEIRTIITDKMLSDAQRLKTYNLKVISDIYNAVSLAEAMRSEEGQPQYNNDTTKREDPYGAQMKLNTDAMTLLVLKICPDLQNDEEAMQKLIEKAMILSYHINKCLVQMTTDKRIIELVYHGVYKIIKGFGKEITKEEVVTKIDSILGYD